MRRLPEGRKGCPESQLDLQVKVGFQADDDSIEISGISHLTFPEYCEVAPELYGALLFSGCDVLA